MEKVFRVNKWFVLFCGLLVVVWAVWQLVANMRLMEEARQAAGDIYDWYWPGGLDCRSSAEITEATVLRRTDTDAIVRVKGKQVLTFLPDAAVGTRGSKVVDVTATLTFYRLSNNWVLGKVELN